MQISLSLDYYCRPSEPLSDSLINIGFDAIPSKFQEFDAFSIRLSLTDTVLDYSQCHLLKLRDFQ